VRAELLMSPSWGASAHATSAAEPPAARVGAWAKALSGRGSGDAWLRVAVLFAEAGVTVDNTLRARVSPYTGWAGFNYDAGLPREQLRDVLVTAARHDIRVGGIQPGLL